MGITEDITGMISRKTAERTHRSSSTQVDAVPWSQISQAAQRIAPSCPQAIVTSFVAFSASSKLQPVGCDLAWSVAALGGFRLENLRGCEAHAWVHVPTIVLGKSRSLWCRFLYRYGRENG